MWTKNHNNILISKVNSVVIFKTYYNLPPSICESVYVSIVVWLVSFESFSDYIYTMTCLPSLCAKCYSLCKVCQCQKYGRFGSQSEGEGEYIIIKFISTMKLTATRNELIEHLNREQRFFELTEVEFEDSGDRVDVRTIHDINHRVLSWNREKTQYKMLWWWK